jgi:SPP1 gp7 family putative phage head morphogenesis protein
VNELFLSALLLFAAPHRDGGDAMNLGQRIRAAFGLVLKGSLGPLEGDFNRLIDYSGMSGASLKEPYKNSPWVQRAIKLVALPIQEVPLRISTDERGGRQLLNDKELNRYWESPALGPDKRPLAFADVIESSVGWLKLAGELFWLLDDTIFASRENLPFPEAGLSFPRFVIAKPDQMKALTGRTDNALLGWEWSDGKGRKVTLDQAQVVHIRFWNPYDDLRGLSEYAAAAIAAEGDYLAGVLKRNVMKANGDQGQIVGVKTPLDDTQRKQLEAQLREKRELAARGIYKTIFLGSDITVADAKLNIVDSSFPLVRAEDRHAVAIAFGVPPSMFEVTASYSIGSASDRYRLIVDTSMPTGRKLTEAIESIVNLQRPGKTLFAWFDWRQHQVMQQVLRELIEPASKLWDRGMSWETISEWLALNLPEFDGRDVAYLPFSATPLSQVGMDTTEDFNEPLSDEEEKMLGCSTHSGNGDAVWKRPAAEIKQWRSHMNARLTTIKRYENAFNRELFKARKETLAKLNALASPIVDGPERKDGGAAADFIFDLAKWRGGLLGAMRKEGRLALDTAGRQLLLEIGIDDPWKYPPEKALTWLARRDLILSKTSEDISRQVRDVIAGGLEKGDSIGQISNAVRDEFNGISKARAKTIAVTETAGAYGEARQEAMTDSDIPFKKWLSSGGSNVRPTHQEANGQVVRVEEPFEVGEYQLMGPGDPSLGAGPEEIINCHCVAIAVSKETGEIEA